MSAVARLLLLAALPSLAGLGSVRCEVLAVAADTRPSFAELSGAPDGAPDGLRMVVAAVGGRVALECRVLRLGDRTVSWVRSRDLQILSHAGAVFTADARVSLRVAAEGGAGSTLHALLIEPLRESDAGRYECQVNTEPKMSLFFNLTVVDEPMPRLVVSVSAHEVRAVVGGTATLACEARYSPPPRLLPLPALDVRWLHDGHVVDLQGPRGGVALDTQRWPARATSTLTLTGVSRGDAGRYACSAGGERAELLLRVTQDEGADGQMEAMQRDQGPPAAGGAAPLSTRLAAATLASTLAVLFTT